MTLDKNIDLYKYLKDKSISMRKQTLQIHKFAQGTRIASSLSAVEIFSVLFFGKILNFKPDDIKWEERDRFIVSKGHGSISLYPVLAECGFFDKEELEKVCKPGSFLGGIPDCIIPGYETTNGSLGHGLGVACGIALALKNKKSRQKVFVLLGDGELYEGAIWEAVMFAAEHKLDNLIAILDKNKVCMLDYCNKIINLDPLDKKFQSFDWKTKEIDGHNIEDLFISLTDLKNDSGFSPKILIANTIKGKGVPSLENDSLSHIRNINPELVDKIIEDLK
jgi:transketolase